MMAECGGNTGENIILCLPLAVNCQAQEKISRLYGRAGRGGSREWIFI